MRPELQGNVSSASVQLSPSGVLPRSNSLNARLGWLLIPALAVAGAAGCSGADVAESGEAAGEAASAISLETPVRLALEVDNGVGTPVQVRAGQTFYVNQIDLRAAVPSSVDEGIASLQTTGDFAGLNWGQPELADTDMVGSPSGTFARHRYYRYANWMKQKSSFKLEQLDAAGHPIGSPIAIDVDNEESSPSKRSDGFFVRRMRAIQWTNDCASPVDCSGAASFLEEALVEVRHATNNVTPFAIAPATTALRLTWSARPGPGYIIPVTQVAAAAYDYGLSIDLNVLTPTGDNGSFAPGTDVTVQATLRDASGNRLHPEGSMPSYLEVMFGPNPAGIQYYRAFFDPTLTYYRRKHREGMMMMQLSGPVQDLHSASSITPVMAYLGANDVQEVADPEVDGFLGQTHFFPSGNMLLGGAFDPMHQAWMAPVSDTVTFHLPDSAAPGTYVVSMKARRTYLGEDLTATSTINIQVGSPTPTVATPTVGGCNACHSGGGSLGKVGHANADLSTCAGCHAPFEAELGTSLHARMHFVHSRSSDRYDRPLNQCSSCHLGSNGIQRTSKSACMSCHTSYPANHVAQFGPASDPLSGGGPEAFGQCSTTCHTTHPGSGL